MASTQTVNSAFVYRRSNGIPAYYKVGYSDHKYSFPCVGDVLFGWEAKESNFIPKITLKTSGAPSVTLNSFDGSIYSIIDYAPSSTEHSVQAYRNSTASGKIPTIESSGIFSGNYCAYIGTTFPTSNLYTDKTNRSYLSIFNGGTAHIYGIDDKVCPNGVLLQNAIMIKTSSTAASFAYSGNYYRRTSGNMLLQVFKLGTTTSSFTIDTSGSTFYIIRNALTISASDIAKYGVDDDIAVGNGFVVGYNASTTIEILGCFMSMKRLSA